jgi:hypothetical protein
MRETYHTSLEYIMRIFIVHRDKKSTYPFSSTKNCQFFFSFISPKNIKERQIDEGRKSPLQ